MKGFEVGVFEEVLKIVVTEGNAFFERGEGFFSVAEKRVAARKVIINDGIILAKAGKAFIDLQAFL